jgi:hypothetical protein
MAAGRSWQCVIASPTLSSTCGPGCYPQWPGQTQSIRQKKWIDSVIPNTESDDKATMDDGRIGSWTIGDKTNSIPFDRRADKKQIVLLHRVTTNTLQVLKINFVQIAKIELHSTLENVFDIDDA